MAKVTKLAEPPLEAWQRQAASNPHDAVNHYGWASQSKLCQLSLRIVHPRLDQRNCRSDSGRLSCFGITKAGTAAYAERGQHRQWGQLKVEFCQCHELPLNADPSSRWGWRDSASKHSSQKPKLTSLAQFSRSLSVQATSGFLSIHLAF